MEPLNWVPRKSFPLFPERLEVWQPAHRGHEIKTVNAEISQERAIQQLERSPLTSARALRWRRGRAIPHIDTRTTHSKLGPSNTSPPRSWSLERNILYVPWRRDMRTRQRKIGSCLCQRSGGVRPLEPGDPICSADGTCATSTPRWHGGTPSRLPERCENEAWRLRAPRDFSPSTASGLCSEYAWKWSREAARRETTEFLLGATCDAQLQTSIFGIT